MYKIDVIIQAERVYGKQQGKMKNSTKDIFKIPNILSVFRIILIPVFIYCYFVHEPFKYASFVVVAVSFLTDVVDGAVARKYDLITELGRILDPLADKLTQVTILVSLWIDKRIPLIVLLIVICKELTMLIGAIYIKGQLKSNVLSSNIWGKCATGTFYMAVAMFLLDIVFAKYMMYLSIALMIIAFITYVNLALKLKRDVKGHNEVAK